tara:strand:+ start:456 stop:1112 length:657 start_codon:yes stop_codon:yes gene_type:complete
MKKEFQKRIISTFILIPISFFFIIKGSFFLIFFLITCFAVTSYEWYMMRNKKKYHLIGYFFLIFSFYSAYLLRNFDNDEKGILFLLVIIICISTDIGGYVVGKIFKGPKLTKVSPNKTYSGMIGSYLLSIIVIGFFIKYSKVIFNEELFFSSETFIFIILISSISQSGDILISYFKRLSKIKDTGKIIPGHGGLLDRIDGMIFAFPISYVIIILGILK